MNWPWPHPVSPAEGDGYLVFSTHSD